jgi:hypothetical protein
MASWRRVAMLCMNRIPTSGVMKKSIHDRYQWVEYLFGVLCPILGVLSVLESLELLRWTFLLMLWMSIGHFTLYVYDVYPSLQYRPFAKGMFVFGVGLLWPVWCAVRVPKRKFWS